jgi:hypothetical protein
MEHSKAQDSVTAGLITQRAGTERVGAGGVFTVTCVGADGQEKWSDTFHNLVVNEGLQDMNSKYFAASGYTAAWYLGLVEGPGSGNTYAAADTLASHAGWTELAPTTDYTGNRKTATFGTATTADPSVISNTASPASFAMLVNGTVVAGALLASVNSGTSGVLFSVGSFTGGDKTVDNGDTLNVTYSFSLDAA